MDELLKPCPFCGGKAVFKHHNIGGAGHILLAADATVECSKCGLVFPKRYSTVVVEGENVEKGQSLGTVGNTAAFEIVDEPHLHFEIIKDNVQVDPNIYLK